MMNRAKRQGPIKQWRAACTEAPRHIDDVTEADNEERAAANVAQWRKFLPEDCIKTMIKDGWHRKV